MLLIRHAACLYSCGSFGNQVGTVAEHLGIVLSSVKTLGLVLWISGSSALVDKKYLDPKI